MATGDLLSQPIPLARSILWAPLGVPRPDTVEEPVFIAQPALRAIAEHLATPPPPGQGLLGFLLGDRCECPETSVVYSVVDAAVRLNQVVYGDKTRDIVTRLRDRLAKQLAAQRAQLIGWYHTHAPLPLELSPHDDETQAQHFAEPWQVAMLLGTNPEEPGGAMFRRSQRAEWVRTPVPFYELLDDESFRPGGKKRSFLNWKTYRPYSGTPPASTPAAAPSRTVTPRSMPKVPRVEAPPPPPPEPLPEPPSPRARQSGGEKRRSSDELIFLSAAEDHAREAVVEPPLPPPPPSPPAPPPSPIHAPTLPPAPPPPPPRGPGQRNSLEGLVVDGALGQVDDAVPPRRSRPDLAAPAEARQATFTSAEWRIVRARRRRFRRMALGILAILLVVGAGVLYGPMFWERASSLLPQIRPLISSIHLPKLPALPSLPTLPWQRKTGTSAAPVRSPSPAPAPAATPAPGPTEPHIIPPPATPSLARLDMLSDSLAHALNTFGSRYRLFAEHRLDCPELARAASAVENRLVAYNAGRAVVTGPLDAARAARERELSASAGSAGERFQQTRCEKS